MFSFTYISYNTERDFADATLDFFVYSHTQEIGGSPMCRFWIDGLNFWMYLQMDVSDSGLPKIDDLPQRNKWRVLSHGGRSNNKNMYHNVG
jgi:hypothetical protein